MLWYSCRQCRRRVVARLVDATPILTGSSLFLGQSVFGQWNLKSKTVSQTTIHQAKLAAELADMLPQTQKQQNNAVDPFLVLAFSIFFMSDVP